jgi:uncharacterized membrane protein
MRKFKDLVAVVARWLVALQQGFQVAASLGGWPVLYPAILGVALAAALLDLEPSWGRALHARYGAIIVTLLAVALAHGVVLAVGLWRKRKTKVFSWVATSQLLWRKTAFLAALPLLVELRRPLERENPFLALTYTTVVALLVGYSACYIGAPTRVTQWWDKQRSRRWTTVMALTCLVALWLSYSLATSWTAIANHMSFNTGRIDLGWYVNLVRRSSIGDFLGCTLCSSGTHINAHFDPILVLISPLYLIHPEAETLLALQSLWLGAGVFPLYALARHQGLGRGVTLGLCASYCMFPALHGINLFDFHSLAFAVPVVLLLWLCFEKGWIKRYFAVLALLLLVREDMALLSTCLGMTFLVAGRQHSFKIGASTVLIAASYFLLVKGVIMPNSDLLNTKKGSQGYGYFYTELLPKGSKNNVGETTAGVLTTLISNPARVLEIVFKERKLLYVTQLLVPVLGIPLLARWGKFALVYGFAFTLLASREHIHSIHFQYSANLVPIIFALLVSGVVAMRERWGTAFEPGRLCRGVVIAILVSSAMASWKFGGVTPNASFKGGFERLERAPSSGQFQRDAWLKQVCRRIPEGASITAPSPMIPHLGRCKNVINYMKPERADYVVWLSKGKNSEWTQQIKSLLDKGKLKEMDSKHGLTLYRAVR